MITRKIHKWCLLAAVMLPALGCLSGTAQEQVAGRAGSGTVVIPGDVIGVVVYGEPDLSGAFRVSTDGALVLPMIGSLKVSGEALEMVQRQVEDTYRSKGFLVNPQVLLSFADLSGRGIAVVGEVVKPGTIPVLGRETVTRVIAEAGGLTPEASCEIFVKHSNTDAIEQHCVNWWSHPSDNKDFFLEPGDTVRVGRTGTVYAVGEVGKPGGFPITFGSISVPELVSLAGGTKSAAKTKHIRIIRRAEAGGHTILEVDLQAVYKGAPVKDIALMDGDIVYVPINAAKAALQRGTEAAIVVASGVLLYRSAR